MRKDLERQEEKKLDERVADESDRWCGRIWNS